MLTSDIDMLPLSDYWTPKQHEITCYGKDLSDEHYPICYIAMSPEKWRDVMSLSGNLNMDMEIDVEHYAVISDNRWTIDQQIITGNLKLYEDEIVYINRGKSPYSDYPIGRIDRSAWADTHKETERIDCHMPRPAHTDGHWNMILGEIKQNLNPTEEDLNWLNEYRRSYISML
jgi:hypothetical protein